MKIALITIIAVILGYYLLPFIGSFIAFTFKSFLFHFILDYGLYILAFVGGGGYFWWKNLRKLE